MATATSTIKDQYATCSHKAAEARSKQVDATTSVYLRPHEGLYKLITPVSAGHRCASEACGHAPIVQVGTAWDHRITSDYCRPEVWAFGEDWFSSWRHADGTPCGMEERYDRATRSLVPQPRASVWAWARCGACGAHDTLVREQRAYGDDVTCSACGDHHYYSIGD